MLTIWHGKKKNVPHLNALLILTSAEIAIKLYKKKKKRKKKGKEANISARQH
jgi:hypothetical protein